MDTNTILDFLKQMTDSKLKKAVIVALTGGVLYQLKNRFGKIKEDIDIDEASLLKKKVSSTKLHFK